MTKRFQYQSSVLSWVQERWIDSDDEKRRQKKSSGLTLDCASGNSSLPPAEQPTISKHMGSGCATIAERWGTAHRAAGWCGFSSEPTEDNARRLPRMQKEARSQLSVAGLSPLLHFFSTTD